VILFTNESIESRRVFLSFFSGRSCKRQRSHERPFSALKNRIVNLNQASAFDIMRFLSQRGKKAPFDKLRAGTERSRWVLRNDLVRAM
jgi:hypothetical protein